MTRIKKYHRHLAICECKSDLYPDAAPYYFVEMWGRDEKFDCIEDAAESIDMILAAQVH